MLNFRQIFDIIKTAKGEAYYLGINNTIRGDVDLNSFLTLMLVIGGSILFVLTLFLFEWLKRKKIKKILNNIFLNYSTKVDADIVRFSKNIITTGFSHTIYNIDVIFNYNGTRQHYTIKTNNHSAHMYKEQNTIPICFIPQYFDYRTGKITKEELFRTIGFKFEISNIDIYPMAIFEEDNK